jgi:DNA repair protein RadD
MADEATGPGAPEGGVFVSAKPLRPYQARALADAKAAYRAGKRAILLVCPTGGGKTRMGTEIVTGAIRKGGSVLWLAHREELLEQAARSIMAEGVERVGIIAPWARRQHADVQVASVQTLAAQLRKDRALPPARVVVFDEAHHFAADEWGKVAAAYKDSAVLGLTATPERGDGRALGDLFDTLIPVSSVRELQELGVLVPCVTYRPDHRTKALCREPIQAYQEHGAGERAFVFCASVAHAEMVAQTFNDAGIPAGTIHADTPWNLRRARVESFKSQDPTPLRRAGSPEDAPLVLCNVYTLTEGVDVPEASVCIVARGCGHQGMLLQMVGRVLRCAPGKERAIFWDLRGTTHKHGLPEADREYSLDGKAIKASKSEKDDPPRKCKSCGGEFMSWAIDRETGDRFCPLCRAPAPEIVPPEVVEREVFAVGSGADAKAQRAELDRLAIEAVDRGYRRGWIVHRYTESFGVKPDWDNVLLAMRAARELLGVRPDPVEVGAERARLEEIAKSRGIPMSWVDQKMADKYGDQAA